MKKIILSAYACSPKMGSEEGNGWSWATNLASMGYHVWCLTNSRHRADIEEALAKSPEPRLQFVFVEIGLGLDRKLVTTRTVLQYLHYSLWRAKASTIAKELENEHHFDIAHHVTYGSLQQGSFLWKLKKPKLIFGPVGGGQQAPRALKSYFGKAWRMESIRALVSSLLLRFNRDYVRTIKHASHILVTNRETENVIRLSDQSSDHSNIHLVLDNAVPLVMHDYVYTPRRNSDILELLWVGRMFPRKGLNLVLHALSFVPANVQYRLTIVGGGERFNELQGWIREYGLNPEFIIVKGQVPFSEVINYYKQSDAFIFCSMRDSCPAQLTEAMAYGLPAIVLNIHGSAVAVPDDCGIKVDVGEGDDTARGIAAAVTRMYNERDGSLAMGYNAYRNASALTWPRKISFVTDTCYETTGTVSHANYNL